MDLVSTLKVMMTYSNISKKIQIFDLLKIQQGFVQTAFELLDYIYHLIHFAGTGAVFLLLFL